MGADGFTSKAQRVPIRDITLTHGANCRTNNRIGGVKARTVDGLERISTQIKRVATHTITTP